jgi:hypothetical protein
MQIKVVHTNWLIWFIINIWFLVHFLCFHFVTMLPGDWYHAFWLFFPFAVGSGDYRLSTRKGYRFWPSGVHADLTEFETTANKVEAWYILFPFSCTLAYSFPSTSMLKYLYVIVYNFVKTYQCLKSMMLHCPLGPWIKHIEHEMSISKQKSSQRMCMPQAY